MRWPGFRKVRKQVRKRIGRRMQELKLTAISEYQTFLESHPEEWSNLDSFCRISISCFYRNRRVFERLRDRFLPELAEKVQQRNGQIIRCWCAGCASGEEPYTLMLIWKLAVASQFPEASLKITATDVDEQMLERSRRACYPKGSLRELPPDWVKTAFESSDDEFELKPENKTDVEFLRQDIRQEQPPGPFDLILCRNLVFTYFDESLQREILTHIENRLFSDGILVIGKKETLPPDSKQFTECEPWQSIYRPQRWNRLCSMPSWSQMRPTTKSIRS